MQMEALRDTEYLLKVQYDVESKQVDGSASIAVRQARGRLHRGQILTAGFVRNQQVINEMIQKDYLYCFLKDVRGSPAYFKRITLQAAKSPCWIKVTNGALASRTAK